jgi:hypothetical protein
MGYVDFKITTWERVWVDDENFNEVIDQIKSGEIGSSDELINSGLAESGSETNFETEEQMTPEDNDGQSTIEVYNDDKKVEYTNGNI